MKQLLLLMVFCNFVKVKAQNELSSGGIKWVKNLTWEEIKKVAKLENKYIFIDCYATWCLPCKEMDKKIYPLERIGNIVNDKFIALKLQMDSAKNDNKEIQTWYALARYINQSYKINAYPTFLFFTADGKLIHRGFGYKREDAFIELLATASNPQKQFYTLIENYKSGLKNYNLLPSIANAAKALNENILAEIISKDYLQNYLYRQDEEIFYNKGNLDFMRVFIRSSSERGFKFFYKNSNKIDQIVGVKNYSQSLIDFIIIEEEITPKIWKNGIPLGKMPMWENIRKCIAKKYGNDYADRTVINSQLKWYKYNNDWKQLAKYNVLKIEKYGLDTVGLGKAFMNNLIWDVLFMHCEDTVLLNKGIKWMEVIVRSRPDDQVYIDTYANLLYKVGRKADALWWEDKALQIAIEKKSNEEIDSFREIIRRMEMDKPTWGVIERSSISN